MCLVCAVQVRHPAYSDEEAWVDGVDERAESSQCWWIEWWYFGFHVRWVAFVLLVY